MDKDKLWSDTVNSYAVLLKYNNESADRMRTILRNRFPTQSKVFDAMDKEALK